MAERSGPHQSSDAADQAAIAARQARRAAQRTRLRRRRRLTAAGALVVLAAVGLVLGMLGGSMRALPRPPATARPGQMRAARRRRAAPRRPAGARGKTALPLPSQAVQQAAVARLVRLGLPIFRAGPSGRAVALTFDDGPGPDSAAALRALSAFGARATFFLVGRNLASWPRLPAQEATHGALGDHTWHHLDLVRLSAAARRSELLTTRRAIVSAGGRPVLLFRPPYGSHDGALDALVRRLGMLQVLWSVDTRDSEGAGWRQILATAERGLRPGAIILFHENRGQTLKALHRLLPELRRRGLRAVSVPELLALDPPSALQVRRDARRRPRRQGA